VLWPFVSRHLSPLDYTGAVTDCVNGPKLRSCAAALADAL
jgi:hypothetical protein